MIRPEEERPKDPLGPPLENLFAAADYLERLLTRYNIKYAVMGGFALICHGSPRTTRDIDIVTAASMNTLWQMLEPQTRAASRSQIQSFWTEQSRFSWRPDQVKGDADCQLDRDIEVDLIVPGFKGTPLSVTDHIKSVPTKVFDRHVTFPTLDILYLMKTKLKHCATRKLPRDIKDVQFLLERYEHDVAAIAKDLDGDEVDSFFAANQIAGLPENQRARYSEILKQ